ncbi:hypothetical protein [Dactylosporangium sp. AC04546]|uniref:hypothetical protein n=1 Tax=Dactylosporangium sp. AC04546 TaxID=2862460 RepID=UPI003FA41B4A
MADPATVSTNGRPAPLELQDRLIHQDVTADIRVVQAVEKLLDLDGHEDLPSHSGPLPAAS